jgi:2-dehydropantoate 2-reductase
MLRLALDAAEEGRALGRAVGKAEAWAATLLRFVGPLALKAGVGVARVRAPEAVRYVEEHFGRKLHSQNTAMAAGIVALAEDMGVRHEALLRLQARLTPSGA